MLGKALQGEAEEAEIVMKALAEEDCLAKKLASSAACDEEEMDRETDELIADIWMEMNRKAEEEMMAALELVQEEKEKQDMVGVSLSMQGPELKQGSHPYLMQVEGPKVSRMKAEAETTVDRMHSTLEIEQELEEEKMAKEEMDLEPDKLLAAEWKESRSKDNFAEAAERPDFKKLMLRQLNLNTKEVEKHADAKQLYIMRAETDEVGEVVKMLGNATQMKMSSKLLIEEVGEVVTKANPEAREKFNKCENSFPYEPGADSEQSKIKEVKEIDPSAHWIRWRKCGAAECFPRLSKKAEMAEAQTSSKEEKTKSSHPEMKVDGVLYTAEQRRLLAEVEAWGEEDAEPGPHVELLPASKELLAEVEAWGHVDAEADIFERSESKQEAEVKLAAHTTKAEAVERSLPRLEKVESNSMIDELAEKSASNQLEEEMKKEQGGDPPLIIDKENLVKVSLSEKVEMKPMHALKAEAVQCLEVKLMEEKLMELVKQCLKLKACEEEEHEALQLLVDKQAAAAG